MAEELYATQEQAVEAAKALITPDFAPLGRMPRVYAVEALGLKVVCLPWSHTKMKAAIGRIGDIDSVAGKMALAEAQAVDTIFWIEGQREGGRHGALKYARALADLGDEYLMLLEAIAAACIAEVGGKK